MQVMQDEDARTADHDKVEEYIAADGKYTCIIIQDFCDILTVQSVVQVCCRLDKASELDRPREHLRLRELLNGLFDSALLC